NVMIVRLEVFYRAKPHRFSGTALSRDDTEALSLSERFGRFLGIGFMAEYADSTWFMSLPKGGQVELRTSNGVCTVSRADTKNRWPDYLAAPFDPTKTDAKTLGAIYPLEFKGTGSYVDFKHKRFQEWLLQSTNLVIQAPVRSGLAMK